MKSMIKWCSTSYRNWRVQSKQSTMVKLYDKKRYSSIPKLFKDRKDYAEITLDGFPFTYFLVSQGNRQALDVFLRNVSFKDHLPLDDSNPFKANLLVFAYLENQQEIVEYLEEEAGFQVGAMNFESQNLMHLAAIYRRKDAFMASIRKKVDHNLADHYGNTPLHYACRTGEVEFVEALLAGKAHKTANQNDLFPIHMAVESLNPAVVELLKKDLWLKYPMFHPMHSASRVGACEIMTLILSKDPTLLNVKDQKQLTPLHHAVATQNPDSLSFLLRQDGLVLDAKDEFGNTALHIAFMRDDIQTVSKLVDRHADLDIENKDYLTPVDLGLDSSSQRTKNYLNSIISKSQRLQSYNSQQ